MSKLIENKQIIHIIAELVVIAGLVLYFTSKNKKMNVIIDELSYRLEQQEEIIQKHEDLIKQLISQYTNSTQQKPIKNKIRISPIQSVDHKNIVKVDRARNTKYEIQNVPPLESCTEDDSDLDDEIADELKELKEDSLKNKNIHKKNE